MHLIIMSRSNLTGLPLSKFPSANCDLKIHETTFDSRNILEKKNPFSSRHLFKGNIVWILKMSHWLGGKKEKGTTKFLKPTWIAKWSKNKVFWKEYFWFSKLEAQTNTEQMERQENCLIAPLTLKQVWQFWWLVCVHNCECMYVITITSYWKNINSKPWI